MALDKELDRTLALLRRKIRERGFTQLEVQHMLGWGRSYLSQLLTKQKALRVEQVLMILEVIKVEPAEFYRELYQFPEAEIKLRDLEDYPSSRVGEGSRAPGIVPEAAGITTRELVAECVRSFQRVESVLRGVSRGLAEDQLAADEPPPAAVDAEEEPPS